ncbi:hypothetical protein BKA69DRAFT_1128637 [Paraphysoderma sedebokerense]|nr:hypothetical protein BKA69DRAFT_1128637 [Paraphysoderma sedebokerense]
MSKAIYAFKGASFMIQPVTATPAPDNDFGKFTKPTKQVLIPAKLNAQNSFDRFVEAKYTIDIDSHISQRQKELEVAKRLSVDIASKEKDIEMLNERITAILEIANFINQKLLQDDTLHHKLSATIRANCSETESELLKHRQELEHLKKLEITLQEKLGICENRLRCTICMELKEEIMAAGCGHTCCRGCSTRRPKCNVCKTPANWRRIFI